MLAYKLPPSRFKIIFREIGYEEKDSKSAICNIAKVEHCDLVFMGAFGRKGDKLCHKGRQGKDRVNCSIDDSTTECSSYNCYFIRSNISS